VSVEMFVCVAEREREVIMVITVVMAVAFPHVCMYMCVCARACRPVMRKVKGS
jgi:hypothetical protein